jgi:Tfp pilus assembly protein PilP
MISFSKLKSIILVPFFVSSIFVCMFPVGCFSEDKVNVPTEVTQPAMNEEFVYNPIGLRDPFTPLVQKIQKSMAKPKRDLGPLEKYDLGQFELLAMMIVDGNPKAMVRAPDGKSYTVSVSPTTRIGRNSGIVKRIETKTFMVDKDTGQRIEKSPDRVVVEETDIDNYTGKKFKTERYIEM